VFARTFWVAINHKMWTLEGSEKMKNNLKRYVCQHIIFHHKMLCMCTVKKMYQHLKSTNDRFMGFIVLNYLQLYSIPHDGFLNFGWNAHYKIVHIYLNFNMCRQVCIIDSMWAIIGTTNKFCTFHAKCILNLSVTFRLKSVRKCI
jgi:hypothetical protein